MKRNRKSDKNNAVVDVIHGLLDMAEKVSYYDEGQPLKKADINDYKSGFTQYGVYGGVFMPIGKSTPALPAGWYKMTTMNYVPVPQLMNIRNDELIDLKTPEYTAVLDDVERFWKMEDQYRKYKFPYKRGILMYGRPGTGKSGLLRLIGNELIKQYNGVLFQVSDPNEIGMFEDVFTKFREIEPNRKAVCVMEDIDGIVSYGGSSTARLLNMLDGNMEYDNILFLATTNNPNVLLESLRNRPSRFDRRYEIGLPSKESRELYIRSKFKEMTDDEVKQIIEVSEGFTIDMLKELTLSNKVLGYDLVKTAEMLRELFIYRGDIGSTTKTYDNVSDEPQTFRQMLQDSLGMSDFDEQK